MHDHGQSDSPVVPAKSPNNAGRPVAEGMEGRGLAKGNSGQQNAPRTQGREGTLSALDRVREVAQRDKEVRFTALLHHIYDVERLRAAYFALKRDAAPGGAQPAPCVGCALHGTADAEGELGARL